MKKSNNTKDKPTLYGLHAVREAWLNEDRIIQALYITSQTQKGFEDTLLLARRKGLRRPEPTIIEKQKFDKLLPQGAVHQGIALSCSLLEEHDIQDFIIRSHAQDKTVLAMLDQVTDPHNVGAIMRSASAFGIDGLIMQKKHAPTLHGVLAKTACGAVDHLPVANATNLSRTLEEFKDNGFVVIGLDERGADDVTATIKNHQNPAGQKTKIIIVLGSEGDGIRRLVKEGCTTLARLPTQGAIMSLNVSNAAAVSFYAAMNTEVL